DLPDHQQRDRAEPAPRAGQRAAAGFTGSRGGGGRRRVVRAVGGQDGNRHDSSDGGGRAKVRLSQPAGRCGRESAGRTDRTGVRAGARGEPCDVCFPNEGGSGRAVDGVSTWVGGGPGSWESVGEGGFRMHGAQLLLLVVGSIAVTAFARRRDLPAPLL